MNGSHNFLGLTVVGAAILFLAGHAPLNYSAHAGSPPRLNVKDAAVSPRVKAATSLAPIIKEVSPSVVNIYTTKRCHYHIGRAGFRRRPSGAATRRCNS